MIDWRAIVVLEARVSGASDLDDHTIEELATHLEDLYQAARPAAGHDAARDRRFAPSTSRASPP
jgi:hypothetical protein